MHKFIIENGALRDFDDNDKSLVKSIEPLKGGDGEHYRGVKAVVVSVNDVVLFLEAYEYGKEQFNKYMMVNAKYDSWKTFEKPIELIDDVADDSVNVIVNYKNGDKKIVERKAKVATVTKEVKAEEIKSTIVADTESNVEEIKEEPAMSEVMFTAAQVAALLAATAPATSQIIYRDREVVPEQLKKDLETARKTAATWQSKATELEKQIAELKAQIAASVKEVSATSFVAETSATVYSAPAPAATAAAPAAAPAASAAAPAASAPAASAPVTNPVLEEMEKKQAEFEAKKKREKEEEKACEAILKKAGFDGLSINRLHKRTIPKAAFVAVCKSFGAEKTAEACLYIIRNENGEFEPATLDLFEEFSNLPF